MGQLRGPERDPAVADELAGDLGRYLRSYWDSGKLVEIHIFDPGEGDLCALLVKSPSVPMAYAESIARAALEIDRQKYGERPVRFTVGAESIGRSGSL